MIGVSRTTVDEMRRRLERVVALLPTVTIEGPARGEERLVIWTNNNVTRGKASAAAVHAALYHYGIAHGAVIVLGQKPSKIEAECSTVIRDAGRTEVDPGTVTAGIAP